MDGGTGSSSTIGAMNNLILILAGLAATGAVVLNQTRSLAGIRVENHQLNNQRERLRTHLGDLERRRGELEEHTRAARQEISRWSEQAPSVSRQNPDPIVAPDPLRQGGWPQGTSYFYLPKRDLKSVGYTVFDRDRLSGEAAALFGMSAAEREAVDAAYNRLWQDFRALEIQSLEPVPPPDRWKTMVESISYRIQALDREAGELRTEFETAVNQILGPTRTAYLMEAVNGFLASKLDDLGPHARVISFGYWRQPSGQMTPMYGIIDETEGTGEARGFKELDPDWPITYYAKLFGVDVPIKESEPDLP
jgi:hypothetical protein